VQDWPEQLQDLVMKHGGQLVWNAGCDALGYPPTWAHQMKEFLAVRRAVSNELKDTTNEKD